MARDYSCGSVLLNLINAVHTGSAANLPCVVIKINLTVFLIFYILISNLFTCIYIYIYINRYAVDCDVNSEFHCFNGISSNMLF